LQPFRLHTKVGSMSYSHPEHKLRQLAALESLRGLLHNLEEIIGRLVRLQKSLPAGLGREQLLEEISALDSIADVMRQALDSCSIVTRDMGNEITCG